MSDLKYCQGPKCHTHKTKDRIKGTQGNKTYQTRRRSKFYYGNDNFCSTWCQNDWFNKYGDQAIDHFGRTTEAKHLTEIIKELREILKVYHYKSDTENMSKDVATSLENLLGRLLK